MSRENTRFFALAAISSLALSVHAAAADDLGARAKKPANPTEAIETSRALRRAGRVNEAIFAVQKALESARGNEPVASLFLELARGRIDQNKQKLAMIACGQIHKLSPFDEQLCTAEAQLLSRRGSIALPAAEQALALSPGDYDATVAKGRALAELGKPQEAATVFSDAASSKPDRSEAPRYLGQLLVAQGKKADAIVALRKALAASPDDPEVLVLLGETLDPGKEAQGDLEHALTIRPTFARARARLGEVLLAAGDLDGADQALKAALAIEPRQADWHALLGSVELAKNQPDLALESARDALKIVGNHGPAKWVEAKALAAKGEIDLAVESFQAAYGLMRTDPAPLIDAAHACAKAGRLTTAKAFADRATDDFPKSAAAWEAVGDVDVALKDKAGAVSAYQKALAGDSTADKAAIRRKLAAP